MLWIYGQGFGPNKDSTFPTAENSNNVVTLTNALNSYSCEIHTDKSTTTQLTCYTDAMAVGTYTVRIRVYGALIPLYQYVDISSAQIVVRLPLLLFLSPNFSYASKDVIMEFLRLAVAALHSFQASYPKVAYPELLSIYPVTGR
jgi:hypothetical protein